MSETSNKTPSALQARLELRYAELCTLEDEARASLTATKAEIDKIYFARKAWKARVHQASARAIRNLTPEEIAERRAIVERDRERVRALTRAANARVATAREVDRQLARLT